jgi:archaellum component FlaC
MTWRAMICVSLAAGTFSDAAAKLQGLISTEKDHRAVLENGKTIAKDVWNQLQSQAGESGAFSGIKGTVERIMTRLKDVMKTLQQAGTRTLNSFSFQPCI